MRYFVSVCVFVSMSNPVYVFVCHWDRNGSVNICCTGHVHM